MESLKGKIDNNYMSSKNQLHANKVPKISPENQSRKLVPKTSPENQSRKLVPKISPAVKDRFKPKNPITIISNRFPLFTMNCQQWRADANYMSLALAFEPKLLLEQFHAYLTFLLNVVKSSLRIKVKREVELFLLILDQRYYSYDKDDEKDDAICQTTSSLIFGVKHLITNVILSVFSFM